MVLAGHWVNPDEYQPDAALSREFRDRHGFTDTDVVIGYCGNIGEKQKLNALVAIAEKFAARDPRVQFVIAGHGARRQSVAAAVARAGLRNVLMLPLQPERDYTAFLNGVDLSYIAQADGVRDAFIPSKLYSTFAAGCAVACFANSDAELYRLLWRSHAAFTYTWEETDRFVREMIDVADDRSGLVVMQEAARAFAVSRFTREKALGEFVDAIEGLGGV